MKKTYIAPSAESVSFDTEEILEISYTGTGGALKDKNNADKTPSDEFGAIQIF